MSVTCAPNNSFNPTPRQDGFQDASFDVSNVLFARCGLIRALGAYLFPNIANYLLLTYNESMKIKVIVHEAEEGGYWAEVPSIPGCATQGETFEELLQNLYEAVEGCLSVDVSPAQVNESDRVLEIAV